MDHNFSIFMCIFAAALLLYAAVLGITKDYNLLPYRARISVEPKDPEKYAVGLAKIIALTAVAVAAGAVVSLWNMAAGAVVMILGVIAAIWYGAKKIIRNDSDS